MGLSRGLHRKALLTGLVVALVAAAAGSATFAAFTSQARNDANLFASGTVQITDDDAGSALFSVTGMRPGDAAVTRCIRVTYLGSLESRVRLYADASGALAPYLNLTVTRGTGTASDATCSSFAADATDYLGQGPGVMYAGTLGDFPASYEDGVVDPASAAEEAWTRDESHTYRLSVTVQDAAGSQGVSADATFYWEARNIPGGYTNPVLATQGLVGYWKLGETSGTVAADSKGSNDGTYTGGVTKGVEGLASGTDGAADLDGSTGYVTVPDSSTLSPTAQVSVEAWFRADSLGDVQRVMASKESSYLLRANRSSEGGQLSFFISSGGAWEPRVNSGIVPVIGAIYHVVGTYDGASLRIYVNGELKGTQTRTGAIDDNANALQIGRRGTNSFDGTLDEVAVYDRALAASEVAGHYEEGKSFAAAVLGHSDLVSYWRLGETSGTSAADSKGSNSATYTNSPTLGVSALVPDTANRAVSLDGTNDFVNVPDAPTLDFAGTSAMSVEAWIKPTIVDATARRIASKEITDGGGTQGWLLYFSQSGFGWQRRLNGVSQTASSGSAKAPVVGGVYHVVGTFDGATMRLYVNGAQVGTRSTTQALVDHANPLRIGVISSSTFGAVGGVIDDVAVYSGVLTPEEIADHFGQATYSQEVLGTTGLMSYWRLNEGSGSTASDHKGGNHGTYTNGVSQGTGGLLEREDDKAASFDGVDDYVTVPDAATLDFAGTAAMSVEAWVQPTVVDSTFRRLVSKEISDAGGAQGWVLNFSETGFRFWRKLDGVIQGPGAGSAAPVVGQTYHVVGTFDGSTMRLYVNGAEMGTAVSTTQPLVDHANPVRIGTMSTGTSTAVGGIIDEVAVYSVALTPAQVLSHYDAR